MRWFVASVAFVVTSLLAVNVCYFLLGLLKDTVGSTTHALLFAFALAASLLFGVATFIGVLRQSKRSRVRTADHDVTRA